MIAAPAKHDFAIDAAPTVVTGAVVVGPAWQARCFAALWSAPIAAHDRRAFNANFTAFASRDFVQFLIPQRDAQMLAGASDRYDVRIGSHRSCQTVIGADIR